MNTNPSESTAQLRESSSLNYDENNSQQFLSSIYGWVQTSIFVVDVLENGDFRYVALNSTHERWIGISSEQLKGKTPEEILSPIDAVKVRQHYTDCVRFGKTIDYEECLQLEGVSTWWSTTLTPLRDQNRIYRLVGTSTNITERKQAQLARELVVRRLTEQMRDSLDENQVLQTATRELTKVLNLDCQIELYSPCRTFATVTNTSSPSEKLTRKVADFPEIYQTLLQKKFIQFSEIDSGWNRELVVVTKLICPIFDAEVLGNIWLIKPRQEKFSECEITLVQQVANQCAIAIRQAKLYQTTQQQSVELKKLELLKNEFLKSLSHELRTPITSISLAAQTLESILKEEGLFDIEPVPQLLHILQNECMRQSKLINDLLSLTYKEADTDPLTLIPIDLQTWLTPIVEPFRERMSCQQQQLHLSIETQLPPLNTDITDLERILTELLNNACKYTPAGGAIAVSAYSTENGISLSISNSGVEIAAKELSRIFDPFYRIPNHDPWKFGGTGLGLALVRKLVKHLGATIVVHSAASKTTFTIQFP